MRNYKATIIFPSKPCSSTHPTDTIAAMQQHLVNGNLLKSRKKTLFDKNLKRRQQQIAFDKQISTATIRSSRHTKQIWALFFRKCVKQTNNFFFFFSSFCTTVWENSDQARYVAQPKRFGATCLVHCLSSLFPCCSVNKLWNTVFFCLSDETWTLSRSSPFDHSQRCHKRSWNTSCNSASKENSDKTFSLGYNLVGSSFDQRRKRRRIHPRCLEKFINCHIFKTRIISTDFESS